MRRLASLAAIFLAACSTRAPITHQGPAAEWPHYGNDLGGARYSPLAEITPANVSRLKIAWEYHHGDISGKNPKTGFEATPILAGGTLYFPALQSPDRARSRDRA